MDDDDDRAEINLFSLFSFSREILSGIAVTDENGNKLGHSTVSSRDVWITTPFPVTFNILALSLSLWQRAAAKGISQVVISRITMAAPGMSTSEHHIKLFKCSCTSPNLLFFPLSSSAQSSSPSSCRGWKNTNSCRGLRISTDQSKWWWWECCK